MTSRAVRAGIGSSYIAILWLFVPTVTMIAPTLLPWTFARTNDAVPAPPSADAMAFAVAAPLWITFPNAVVLLRVLQGVGSRSVVGDGLIYLYDAIGGAVIGVLVAATCASLAPRRRRAGASCRARACIIAACACAYAAWFMTCTDGRQWTSMSPQPLVLSHVVSSNEGASCSRAGASRTRGSRAAPIERRVSASVHARVLRKLDVRFRQRGDARCVRHRVQDERDGVDERSARDGRHAAVVRRADARP